MSWLFSQALVEGYWGAVFSDGGQSVRSRETNTPQAFLFSDKTTDSWNPSRFGVTCERLTDARGKDVLTWFLEGFPVRTSAQPGAEKESSAASAPDSGPTWLGLLARFDPGTCSWRTPPTSLLEDWGPSLGRWPRWGTMRSGESWERTMSERLTKGTASGYLLPTPVASDTYHRRGKYKQGGTALSTAVGGKLNPSWVEWLMGWPVGWTDDAFILPNRS